jgi:hypothetical protein
MKKELIDYYVGTFNIKKIERSISLMVLPDAFDKLNQLFTQKHKDLIFEINYVDKYKPVYILQLLFIMDISISYFLSLQDVEQILLNHFVNQPKELEQLLRG